MYTYICIYNKIEDKTKHRNERIVKIIKKNIQKEKGRERN